MSEYCLSSSLEQSFLIKTTSLCMQNLSTDAYRVGIRAIQITANQHSSGQKSGRDVSASTNNMGGPSRNARSNGLMQAIKKITQANALELAQLTRTQILQNAGNARITQANQSADSVASLLKVYP